MPKAVVVVHGHFAILDRVDDCVFDHLIFLQVRKEFFVEDHEPAVCVVVQDGFLSEVRDDIIFIHVNEPVL